MNAPIRSSIPVNQSAMLSPLHAMLATIRRANPDAAAEEAAAFKVKFPGEQISAETVEAIIAEPTNAVLVGDRGYMVFIPIEGVNLFAAHMRYGGEESAWAVLFARACFHWMFTFSGAVEIVYRCPEGENHDRDVAVCEAIGADYEGEFHGGGAADVYTVKILDWIRTAPGLVERGRWFHEKLKAEYARLGKTAMPVRNDDLHNRHMGACAEIMFAGNVGKALLCYNRFARINHSSEIKVVTHSPLMVDVRDAYLMVRGDDFYIYALNHQDPPRGN